MSILLQSLSLKQETRIRLVFTNSLAGGAFGVPAPSAYVVANEDGRAPSPTVRAALVVPSSPNVVELVLDIPIAKSALYSVTAVGVPATDASVTPSGSKLELRIGFSAPKANLETSFGEAARQRLLYFVDLLWNGIDFQKTATGDLESCEGTPNVTKAINNGVESNGLPWDPEYGAGGREFVDSPSVSGGTLRGAVLAQIKRDPRVRSAKVTYEIIDEKTYLYADPVLVTGEDIERVSIEVPNDS